MPGGNMRGALLILGLLALALGLFWIGLVLIWQSQR
jgi:hypothetical protein